MFIIEYMRGLPLSLWLLISLASVITILTIIIIILYLKSSSRHFQLSLSQNTNLDLVNKLQIEQNSNISNLQLIERISSENNYLKKNLLDLEENKGKNVELIKGALFDLGNQLSQQLIEKHRLETKESRELSEKNIETTAQKFNNEFEKLVISMGVLTKDFENSKSSIDLIKNSLLSPSGCGRLAEITLENLLKTSGLRADLDYITQYSFKDVNNLMYRPDAIIFLPLDQIMIIDAKASKFLLEEGNGENLIKTMNNHLKSLNNKEYITNISENFKRKGKKIARISMLMFLPTEQALEKLFDSDATFMDRAYKNNIYPIGPSGLRNWLQLAKLQITEQLRLENHQIILQEIESIIKTISIMSDYSAKLGNNIQSLVSNYDKFAGSFNKNFISRVQSLQSLGIGTNHLQKIDKLTRYELQTTTLNVNEEIEEINEKKELLELV